MSIGFWVALAVIACGMLVVAITSRKRVWYIVYLANNDTVHAYRSGWDKFWRGDEAGIMVFHTEDGKSLRISKHWIIKIVED